MSVVRRRDAVDECEVLRPAAAAAAEEEEEDDDGVKATAALPCSTR